MMTKTGAAIALSLPLLLAACADSGPNETGGALLGGAIGGLIGSQFGAGAGALAMTGAGALAGAALGSEAGKSADRANAAAAANRPVYAYAAPYGTVAPIGGWQAPQAECREFQQNIVLSGRSQKAYGTVCRQPDGSWKIVP